MNDEFRLSIYCRALKVRVDCCRDNECEFFERCQATVCEPAPPKPV